jgi:hypothetical protein
MAALNALPSDSYNFLGDYEPRTATLPVPTISFLNTDQQAATKALIVSPTPPSGANSNTGTPSATTTNSRHNPTTADFGNTNIRPMQHNLPPQTPNPTTNTASTTANTHTNNPMIVEIDNSSIMQMHQIQTTRQNTLQVDNNISALSHQTESMTISNPLKTSAKCTQTTDSITSPGKLSQYSPSKRQPPPPIVTQVLPPVTFVNFIFEMNTLPHLIRSVLQSYRTNLPFSKNAMETSIHFSIPPQNNTHKQAHIQIIDSSATHTIVNFFYTINTDTGAYTSTTQPPTGFSQSNIDTPHPSTSLSPPTAASEVARSITFGTKTTPYSPPIKSLPWKNMDKYITVTSSAPYNHKPSLILASTGAFSLVHIFLSQSKTLLYTNNSATSTKDTIYQQTNKLLLTPTPNTGLPDYGLYALHNTAKS